MSRPVLIIVLAQLFGVSLWFSPNGASLDLMRAWDLGTAGMGYLTSAVQIGFVLGCLAFSVSGLADRYPASRIFAVSALGGAIFNAAFAWLASDLVSGVVLRFLVGVCLAGIYPLGMKLIVGWQKEGTGLALGILVGMLTLGTALPHGVRAGGADLSWQIVVSVSSVLAILAAWMVFNLGEGPHQAQRTGSNPRSAFALFRMRGFRASAFGYFGHMWELYAFWAVAPFLAAELLAGELSAGLLDPVAGLSFAVIGIGLVGAIVGGHFSRRIGSARVAFVALAGSALLCAIYPLIATWPSWFQIAMLLCWGIFVIADSAQFSALSASLCPPQQVGSALALQNSIGFAITIVSISLIMHLVDGWGRYVAWLLLPGPLMGLLALRPLLRGAR